MPAQVTIIIPVYNAEPYLEQCLRSIADQTYAGWLAIVVNDGSTDGSLRVAERFAGTDKRFQVLTIPHAGQSAARNAGLEIVKSAYVCFLDADDWLDSNYLSTLLEHAGSYEVVQSGYRRVTNEGAVTESRLPKHFYQFASPCMRLYRTAVVQDVRFPLGMIYEDVIFSLHLWAKHPTYRLIPYIGYNYRLNPNSTTSHYNQSAQQTLYAAIRKTQAPWWLKMYTILRLKFHFRK